jgi:hypothetical protein
LLQESFAPGELCSRRALLQESFAECSASTGENMNEETNFFDADSETQIKTQTLPIPEDLLARLRKENSELEQLKQLTALQIQVKELQFKNTILEVYIKMGLKPTDSFNINTGEAKLSEAKLSAEIK